MSLFSSLFGNAEHPKQPNTSLDWIDLNRLEQLDEIVAASNQQPILIFKHSTRCAISRMALKDFEKQFKLDQLMACYFLDLLAHREISNAIAHRFTVVHQSPQLLLIKNGECIYHVSHGAIQADELEQFVQY